MTSDLIARIYDSASPELRSVWMERVHVKLADVAAALTHLLAVWDDLDNPTRAEILEETQDRLTDICVTVRGRSLFADDEGKNGGNGEPVAPPLVRDKDGKEVPLGGRVLITGDHAWAGYSGVYARGRESPYGMAAVIELDYGSTCMVLRPEDWQVLVSDAAQAD